MVRSHDNIGSCDWPLTVGPSVQIAKTEKTITITNDVDFSKIEQ